jgi:hypothetical protein
MDLETAKQLVNSPVVQAYIEQIDTDAEAALDAMKTNLGGMGGYPSSAVSEYKSDGAALNTAWGNFNAAWNLIVFEKAKDGKAAMVAYRNYVVALTVLEEDNVVWAAFVEARVAQFATAFIALMIELVKSIRKRFAELLKELEELDKLLKKAKREVKEAEAQRVINLAITAVSLCIPAVGLGAGIAIAATTFTVQMVVDASLGPGDPGVLGTVNTAAGDVIGLPKQIKPKFAKMGSVASAVYTLKLDNDEIDDAKKIVQKIKERTKSIDKTMQTLEPFVAGGAAQLLKMQLAYDKALKVAQSKAKAYKSAEARRLGLLKELNKLR